MTFEAQDDEDVAGDVGADDGADGHGDGCDCGDDDDAAASCITKTEINDAGGE